MNEREVYITNLGTRQQKLRINMYEYENEVPEGFLEYV